VAHCGSSLAGDFVWSLTYTCLGSGWTEGRAVWNKGAHGVVEQDVENHLPLGYSRPGKTGGGAVDQSALQGNVEAVAEIFSAIGQAGGKASGRQPLGEAA
jgi:hypothetical protein